MAPREEPADHVRETELPSQPRWHSIVFPFLLTLATMAVGGMAVSWRDVAVITSRIDALEKRDQQFHSVPRYSQSDADREHRPMWAKINEIDSRLNDLRIEFAKGNH